MPVDLVTTTQLAEIVGVSRQTLGNLVAAGRITVAQRDARGRPLFNSEVAQRECRDLLELNKHKSRHGEEKNRGGRPSASTAKSEEMIRAVTTKLSESGLDFKNLIGDLDELSEAQKIMRVDFVKKLWDARQSELKAREKEGSLIAKETVQIQGARVGAILQGAFNALPDRLSPRLAAMTDPRDIHAELVKEINRMLKIVRKYCGVCDEEDALSEAAASEVKE